MSNTSINNVVVGFVGVAAAALAFAAEATRVKVSDIEISKIGCNYPSTPANKLGYIAALLVVANQIAISTVTGCPCCCRNNSSTSQLSGASVAFSFSWVASVIGIVLLIAGVNLSTRHEVIDATGLCYTVKPGVFAGGGALALVASILGLYAFRYSGTDNFEQTDETMPHRDHGISMGYPQFDNASTNSYPK